MIPRLLNVAFRAMSKMNQDPEKKQVLTLMADEMRSLSVKRPHRLDRKSVNSQR